MANENHKVEKDKLMLDNDALNFLQDNEEALEYARESNFDFYYSAFQYQEFRSDWETLSQPIKDEIILVEKSINPETTGIETSGYGEVYGYNYSGSTGEIFEELIQEDDNLPGVERADMVGAEAAINRDMRFVTNEDGIKKRMRTFGYEENLLSWDDFLKLIGNEGPH